MTFPVRTLPITVIEPSLQPPLVAAVNKCGVADAEVPPGKPDHNRAVRAGSTNKSRTSLGIPGCDKLAAGTPFRQGEPPGGSLPGFRYCASRAQNRRARVDKPGAIDGAASLCTTEAAVLER
jgi:hypothetical protein